MEETSIRCLIWKTIIKQPNFGLRAEEWYYHMNSTWKPQIAFVYVGLTIARIVPLFQPISVIIIIYREKKNFGITVISRFKGY